MDRCRKILERKHVGKIEAIPAAVSLDFSNAFAPKRLRQMAISYSGFRVQPVAVLPLVFLLCGLLGAGGCATRQTLERHPVKQPGPGSAPDTTKASKRQGDEIAVAGRLFHTGTTVVLWNDPGGFSAYGPAGGDARAGATLNATSRFSSRQGSGPQRPGGNWDLDALRQVVDQFVLHYDAAGLSTACFKALNDRALSVHFLLDLDGTIYQTMDLQERAFHATTSNNRSVGVEMANIGAFESAGAEPLREWYRKDALGDTVIAIPARFGPKPLRAAGFAGRPARNDLVLGTLQSQFLRQYDYTPEQYEALARLTAALCRVFPKIRCDYPRDAAGCPVPGKLPDDVLARYQGILGHYHIQANKLDPGPAFQWERFIARARKALNALEKNSP